MKYVLFNGLSNNHRGESNAKESLKLFLNGNEEFKDVTKIDIKEFFTSLNKEDEVILTGGDGTVNHFVNDVAEIKISNNIYYYPSGTGNDFYTDIKGEKDEPVLINEIIKDLPYVIVNDKKYYFVNGVGYGIDGYCCEKGDELQAKSDKPVNYTSICVKGMLFDYKPTTATIKIDDNPSFTVKHCWLVPSMKGRYYGGGMKVTPLQDRKSGKVSVMYFKGINRLASLIMFSKIFTGEHVKFVNHVTIMTGNKIEVEFKDPRPLQIDGEVIKNVKKYTVYTK